MKAYQLIFPDSDEPCMTLSLRHKVGRVPKGSYRFVEGYCCEPHCDCRRAALFVINEKGKEKALISFGFDPDEPMAGPFLDSAHRPAPYAQELVDYFVEMINSDAEWLEGMYQRYQAVREKCDGMPYRGKPFPLPGLVLRRVVPPPSDFEPALEEMLGQLSSREPVSGSQKLRRFVLQQKAGVPAGPDAPVQEEGVEAFVAESEQSGTGWSSYSEHSSLLERLRQHLLSDPRAGEQLVQLLVDLCRQTPETDARRIDAALRVLSDVMQLLKLDLELGRSGGQERMEALQMALAQRIFTEGENIELCAAVSQLLLQNRVEILPELLQAKNQRVLGEVAELDGLPEGDIMEELCHSLEQMGLSSPFEGVETLLRIFALGNAEMQIELTSKLLVARNPFIRDMAALMLFHPDSTVRLGVARLLASSDGHTATAETLRRMIVSRNWFSPPIKKELDQAIIHARKAHVECAPLATHPSMTVYASTIDGAGAQSFQVVISNGKGFLSCSLLLKQGVGVADAFVVSLKNKRELKDFLNLMKHEAHFLESSQEYLDQRVCHALAEGADRENCSSFWLVHIAELLGRDQWMAVPFHPVHELGNLLETLQETDPELLAPSEYHTALEASALWPETEPCANSWLEDAASVDREIELSHKMNKEFDPTGAIARILEGVVEKRRGVWLERLVLSAIWLKESPQPPIPWHRVFHVACAVADEAVPLAEIPLMSAIAKRSFGAYLGRRQIN